MENVIFLLKTSSYKAVLFLARLSTFCNIKEALSIHNVFCRVTGEKILPCLFLLLGAVFWIPIWVIIMVNGLLTPFEKAEPFEAMDV